MSRLQVLTVRVLSEVIIKGNIIIRERKKERKKERKVIYVKEGVRSGV